MSYSYDRRPRWAKETTDDLKKYLQSLKEHLEWLEQVLPQVTSPYSASGTLSRLYPRVKGAAYMLMANLLMQYEVSPKDRKILEAAARDFSKTRVVLRRGKEMAGLVKAAEVWRLYYETAKRILETGQEMGEESKWDAGSFKIVNMGGFPDKVMQESVRVVKEAEQLLKQKGLGKLCYGDVQVTNSIQKSTRLIAFYLVNTDELFLRGNLKGKTGPAVRSVCHELGHRLYKKHMQSNRAEIAQIYRILMNKETDRVRALMNDESLWPKPGEEYIEGKKKFDVLKVKYPKVFLKPQGTDGANPRNWVELPLSVWVRNKAPDSVSHFISKYAQKDPEENFCEMLSFWCLNQLPEDQVNMLKGIL